MESKTSKPLSPGGRHAMLMWQVMKLSGSIREEVEATIDGFHTEHSGKPWIEEWYKEAKEVLDLVFPEGGK